MVRAQSREDHKAKHEWARHSQQPDNAKNEVLLIVHVLRDVIDTIHDI